MNNRTVVLGVEDNRLYREALTSHFNSVEGIDFHVIFTHDDIFGIGRQLKPDILLFGSAVSRPALIPILHQARLDLPSARPILMSVSDQVFFSKRVWRDAGVWGIVDEAADFDELFQAIKAVHSGKFWWPDIETPPVNKRAYGRSTESPLTPREEEIIGLIVRGSSNNSIARSLNVSVHTVKTHLHNLASKLSMRSRVALAVWAMKKNESAENRQAEP